MWTVSSFVEIICTSCHTTMAVHCPCRRMYMHTWIHSVTVAPYDMLLASKAFFRVADVIWSASTGFRCTQSYESAIHLRYR